MLSGDALLVVFVRPSSDAIPQRKKERKRVSKKRKLAQISMSCAAASATAEVVDQRRGEARRVKFIFFGQTFLIVSFDMLYSGVDSREKG